MTTRVVVPQRLGASETLQQRVGSHDHLLNPLNALSTRNSSDILHDPLGRLRLSRARLSGNDDALVVLVGDHVVVGALGDGVDVRRHLEAVLAAVGVEDFVRVDGEQAEGVDGDEDMADVGLFGGEVGQLLSERGQHESSLSTHVDLGVLVSASKGQSAVELYSRAAASPHRFLRFSLTESLEMVERRVISLTPACFFLNPSFQSACKSPVLSVISSRPRLPRSWLTFDTPPVFRDDDAAAGAAPPAFLPLRVGACRRVVESVR